MTDPISDHLAINLDRALKANPNLMHHPDLAYAVANAGGNIEENALELYGIHLKKMALESAMDTLKQLNAHHYQNEAMAQNPESAKYMFGTGNGR